MPADIEQLKTLAEACPQGDPLRLMVSNGAWYIRNTAGIVLDVHRNRSFPQYLAENEAYANFIVAASPAVVLDLLARIDGLVAQHGRDSAELRRLCQARDDAQKERDQLKAEVTARERQVARVLDDAEGLRRDAERYRYLRRPDRRANWDEEDGEGVIDWIMVGDARNSAIQMTDVEADRAIDAAIAKEAAQ